MTCRDNCSPKMTLRTTNFRLVRSWRGKPGGSPRTTTRASRRVYPVNLLSLLVHDIIDLVRLGAVGHLPAVQQPLDHLLRDTLAAAAVLGEQPLRRHLAVDDPHPGVVVREQPDALLADVAAQVGRVPDE